MNEDKHLGFTIDPETHAKLKYIAKYYGRSITAHIKFLIHEDIRNFEKTIEKIEMK